MNISKRLLTVAGMVTKGNRAVDIGCDHGFVPIWLVKNGISPSAVAADVKPEPLNRARAHVNEYGLGEKISLRLSNGLEHINAGDGESLIIAGMGGMLMIKILSEKLEVVRSMKEIIISPQSDIDKVRRFIYDSGLTIVREKVIKDNEKYYFIFYIINESDNRIWEDCDFLYGIAADEDSVMVLIELINSDITKFKALADSLEKGSDGNDRTTQRIDELRRQLMMAERKLQKLSG